MFPCHGHDGGSHADSTFAAIQNQRQAAIHIHKGILCVGGAGLAGVSRRSGKRHAAGFDDRLHQFEGDGMRTPTVSSPAQVTVDTSGPRGMTMVSGPGQNAAASFLARSGTSDTINAAAFPCRRYVTSAGYPCGRPLASKIFLTASPLRASAAMPYTVSAGRATSSLLQQLGGKGNAFLINRQNLSIHRS